MIEICHADIRDAAVSLTGRDISYDISDSDDGNDHEGKDKEEDLPFDLQISHNKSTDGYCLR
jgi:hypothetical protein